jgi:hypothetical protein
MTALGVVLVMVDGPSERETVALRPAGLGLDVLMTW